MTPALAPSAPPFAQPPTPPQSSTQAADPSVDTVLVDLHLWNAIAAAVGPRPKGQSRHG